MQLQIKDFLIRTLKVSKGLNQTWSTWRKWIVLSSVFLKFSISLTLRSCSASAYWVMIQYSCSPSPFVAHVQSACGRAPSGNVYAVYAYNPVCGRNTMLVLALLFSLQRPRDVCKETDISKFPFNVLHTELVCYRCYLQACDQRFVIRLLCLPFQSTKAVYRNVKHLLLTIIPLRMFAWCLFICVCAMGWAKKCVQRQRNPVCSGKSKSNSERGSWGNAIKDHV